jgi:hypothetical protein
MSAKTSAKPNKSKIKSIIFADIRKNGKITADYFKSELDGWTIDEIDFQKIAAPINHTLEGKNISDREIETVVDNVTIDQIAANIKPLPLLDSRPKEKSKYSLSKRNQLMIRMAENLGIQKI